MKTKTKVSLLLIGSITVLLILIWSTRILFSYKVVDYNISMFNRYFPNNIVFASRLKKPQIDEVVIYALPNTPFVLISRIVAMEGDSLQLIDGYPYVNSKPIASSAIIRLSYLIDEQTIKENRDFLANYGHSLEKPYPIRMIDSTKIEIQLTQEELKQLRYSEKLQLCHDCWHGRQYKTLMGRGEWTVLNFGPVVIPEGHCFVLNDYRFTEYDSRFEFHNFIPLENIKGVVLQ